MANIAINSFPGMPREEPPLPISGIELRCELKPDDAFRILRRMGALGPLTMTAPKAQSIEERQSSISLYSNGAGVTRDSATGCTVVLKRDGTWALLKNIIVT